MKMEAQVQGGPGLEIQWLFRLCRKAIRFGYGDIAGLECKNSITAGLDCFIYLFLHFNL